jgi:hypothetical protein
MSKVAEDHLVTLVAHHAIYHHRICIRLIRLHSKPSSYSRHQRSHKNEKLFVCELSHCRQKCALPPLFLIIANSSHFARFPCKTSLDQHQLQHEEQEMAFEQQRGESFALNLSSCSPTVALAVPPTSSSVTFQNGDKIIWDALPCHDIDMILARLTQPPNPDIVPCPTTPAQSQIHHCDGQYVYWSETGQRCQRTRGWLPLHLRR